MHETTEKPKRAFLVSLRDYTHGTNGQESMERELAGLAGTLGLETAGTETVRIRENHPKFGMGVGKVQELTDKALAVEADCIIFDRDISPSQQRNWEALCGIPVVDRQELIIQIFAGRAKTREAELQVALAELSYALPRLTHKYIDLSRQRGGHYGAKGSGETRLEQDRRLIQARIQRLKKELAEVRKQRNIQRKKRERAAIPCCALVGYTNAGKSSLLNALTNAGVFVEDKLFATLDTAARQFEPAPGCPAILIDTVGFIRNLPHNLIDAFRSTLEEAGLSRLIIHVLDASDPDIDRYFETTQTTLRELGAGDTPMLTVLNKADRLDVPETMEDILRRYPGALPVSAQTRSGLDALCLRIAENLQF
jgi:GTP-binding protein HflX